MGMQQEPAVLTGDAGEASSQTVRRFTDLAREDHSFYVHARSALLLDMVEQLLGLPLQLFEDEALLKPPLVGSETPEHQDNACFRVEPADHLITCWTALDDADPENGCLYYYPGSHLEGLLPHRSVAEVLRLEPERLDRAGSQAVPMPAGGCILHHPLTAHWSPANRSSRWRRAFVCRYVRADAVMGARQPNSPPLLEVRS
jgi:phytanoyl-CoA hydroxylase